LTCCHLGNPLTAPVVDMRGAVLANEKKRGGGAWAKNRARSAENLIDFDFIAVLDFAAPLKRMQKRSMESRARLVEVSCDAFMRRGYESVSTHDVAAAAGVTQGLIVYHFSSKEGLWQAAMDRVFGDFRNSLATCLRDLKGRDERTVISEMIRHVVGLEQRYPSIARFMIESGKEADQHLVWLLHRHIKPIYDVISHIFEVAQRRGILRALPITNAYYVLLTAGSIFSLEDEIKLIAGQNIKSHTFAEAHVQCLTQMLLSDA